MDSDICEICGECGELYICDQCGGTWHGECHPIPIPDEDGEWTCHRCFMGTEEMNLEKLTEHGHLDGCLGRHKPNILAPKCCTKTESGGQCAAQVSKQSCLWMDLNHFVYGQCHHHWFEYCMEKGYDPDLSKCANRVTDQSQLSLKARGVIDEFNIKMLLGLDVKCRGVPTNHLSKARELQGKISRKAARGRRDRRRIELHAASDRFRDQVRLATAQSNVGYELSYDADDSEDVDFNLDVPEEELGGQLIDLVDDSSEETPQSTKRSREETEELPPAKRPRLF